ncbi:MAG: hypothetical protein HYZ00_01955 [Candidatus Hydrogenedentes bacterium]|nr:hypothetical protein [Candidatus Hydrogenedentota bacterium]
MRARGWLILFILVFATLGLLLITSYDTLRQFRMGGLPLAVYLDRGRLSADLAAQKTAAITLDVSLLGTAHPLAGSARLDMASNREEVPVLRLFLNPQLNLVSVKCNGQPVRASRQGEFLAVHPKARAKSYEVEIVYEGTLAACPAPVRLTENEIILAPAALWYPTDLQSFSTVEGTLTLPGRLRPVAAGQMKDEAVSGDLRTVTWASGRPVAGITVAAAPYEERQLGYGSKSFYLHTAGPAPNAEAFLRRCGEVHAYLETLLGPDHFPALHLVRTDAVHAPLNGGNAVILLPAGPGGSNVDLAALAKTLAESWWPGTVGVALFPERPSGNEWIARGLPRYAGGLVTEYFEGPQSAAVESRDQKDSSPRRPLRMLDRQLSFDDDPGLDEAVLRDLEQVTREVAAEVGPQHFLQACRNLLRTHEYGLITLLEFQTELEVVAEKDLDEFLRVRFDLPRRNG